MKRTTEKTLPITWDGWDMAGDYGEIQFYNVEFTDNFGPFKKGDEVACLMVSNLQARVEEVLEEGTVGRSCGIKYVAV